MSQSNLSLETFSDSINDKLDLVCERLAALSAALDSSISDRAMWLDSLEFRKMAGIKNKYAIRYLVGKGCWNSDALKNIGTVDKPRYRFHRVKALDQFLNKASRLKDAAEAAI